jgi:uncharacterized delta-60 repeat protein
MNAQMGVEKMKITILLAVLFTLTFYLVEAAPGDLDLSFSDDGKQFTGFGPGGHVSNAILVQPDGKIVAIGRYGDPSTTPARIAIVRYHSNGLIDLTFGQAGKILINNQYNHPTSAVLHGSNFLVAGIYSDIIMGTSMFLMSLQPNGTLDPAFGNGGIALLTVPYTTAAWDVAVQSDGKIVVPLQVFGLNASIKVARFHANGSVDTGFGTNGVASLDVPGQSEYSITVAIQGDGKIVVGGRVINNGNNTIVVSRFNMDGSVDSAFGTNGSTIFNPYLGLEHSSDIAIQSDGKIVLVGGGTSYVGYGRNFLIARFNSTGLLDTTFASIGYRGVDFHGYDDYATTVLIESGKMIVIGISSKDNNGQDRTFALVRLLSSGNLDSSFGTSGKVVTDLSTGIDDCSGGVTQPDGKVVVIGTREYNRFAVTRYLTN